MFKDQEGWIATYKACGALWIHDNNPERPHALLTSGNHSDSYFNSRMIPDSFMNKAASDLIDICELFDWEAECIEGAQTFVGPQTGATRLAVMLRDHVELNDGISRDWASPAKGEVDGQKIMIFEEPDLEKISGKQVLLCEDAITTCGSVDLTANAVIRAGGSVLPFVLALVNQSGRHKIGGALIVALVHRRMPIWTPDECPLCAQGSEAIRPKGENWTRLNAEY